MFFGGGGGIPFGFAGGGMPEMPRRAPKVSIYRNIVVKKHLRLPPSTWFFLFSNFL